MYAKDIQGASRVIAYIVNRWGDFRKPMYIDKDKHSNFYKLLHKKMLLYFKSLLRTQCPPDTVRIIAFMKHTRNL